MIEEKGVGPGRGEGKRAQEPSAQFPMTSVGVTPEWDRVGVGRPHSSPVLLLLLLLLIICSVSPSTPLVSFRKWTPIFVAVAQSKYLASSRLFCFLASSQSAFGWNSPGCLR